MLGLSVDVADTIHSPKGFLYTFFEQKFGSFLEIKDQKHELNNAWAQNEDDVNPSPIGNNPVYATNKCST